MKPLIILGSASSLLEDYNKALSLGMQDHDCLVVGITALKMIDFPVKYFASYHPEVMPKVDKENKPYKIICHEQYEGMVDIIKPLKFNEEPSGSSSLLGVLAGIDEGYKKIILCGCPMTGKNAKTYPYAVFRKGWVFHEKYIKPYVRSMCGWTKELLGEPTEEWLKE